MLNQSVILDRFSSFTNLAQIIKRNLISFMFCSKKVNLVESQYSFVEAPHKFIIGKLSSYVAEYYLYIYTIMFIMLYLLLYSASIYIHHASMY